MKTLLVCLVSLKITFRGKTVHIFSDDGSRRQIVSKQFICFLMMVVEVNLFKLACCTKQNLATIPYYLLIVYRNLPVLYYLFVFCFDFLIFL